MDKYMNVMEAFFYNLTIECNISVNHRKINLGIDDNSYTTPSPNQSRPFLLMGLSSVEFHQIADALLQHLAVAGGKQGKEQLISRLSGVLSRCETLKLVNKLLRIRSVHTLMYSLILDSNNSSFNLNLSRT